MSKNTAEAIATKQPKEELRQDGEKKVICKKCSDALRAAASDEERNFIHDAMLLRKAVTANHAMYIAREIAYSLMREALKSSASFSDEESDKLTQNLLNVLFLSGLDVRMYCMKAYDEDSFVAAIDNDQRTVADLLGSFTGYSEQLVREGIFGIEPDFAEIAASMYLNRCEG